VAGFGMLLRDSPHKGTATRSSVHALAVAGKGEDASGARADFIALIEMARALQRR
jgi:Ca-activated chloride channel family protein